MSRNIVFSLFSICFLLLSPVPALAVSSEVVTDYRPHVAPGGPMSGSVWLGDKVALFIQDDLNPEARDVATMTKILGWLDQMYELNEGLTGKQPRLTGPYKGRIRVEATTTTPGGFANHGTLGIAVGFGFFTALYERTLGGGNSLEQVYFYESARNYWTSDLNPRIDYHTNAGRDNYGWWTVGFNNALACFQTERMGINLFYFGGGRQEFCQDNMKGKYEVYIGDPQWNWDNAWMSPTLPWQPQESLNDLMTGTLIAMYEQFGGWDFIARLYRAIPQQPELSSMSDNRGAADNFYRAASVAAKLDLKDYFINTLKWNLSQSALDWVSQNVGGGSIESFELPSDRWMQISLPCDPGVNNTLGELFGDDNLGVIGSDWLVYAYDAANGAYQSVDTATSLKQGIGYWILQTTGATQVLDMPASCSVTPRINSSGCPAGESCFAVPFVTSNNTGAADQVWQMIGYPFAADGQVSETHIVSTTGSCVDGCAIGTSEANTIINPDLFIYDGTSYSRVSVGDSFSPWNVFWALSAAGTDGSSAELLFWQR